MVLDVSQSAQVNHHQVDHLQHERDHCVCDQQPVVKIEVVVLGNAVRIEVSPPVGGLRGLDGDGDCNGKLEDEVEGGEDVPGAGSKSVGAEGDEQDEADDEGQSCGDDEEGSELTEIPLRVVFPVFTNPAIGIGVLLVVDVS